MHLFRAAVRFVHLVHHHNRFKSDLKCLLQHKTRLRHRSFKSINEKDATICHVEHTLHLTTKVGVTWSVDDVDFGVFVVDRHVFRKDGDTTFTFEVVIVEHKFARLLVGAEKVTCQEHFVHEGCLTVVYVSNDGDVANVLHEIFLLIYSATFALLLQSR